MLNRGKAALLAIGLSCVFFGCCKSTDSSIDLLDTLLICRGVDEVHDQYTLLPYSSEQNKPAIPVFEASGSSPTFVRASCSFMNKYFSVIYQDGNGRLILKVLDIPQNEVLYHGVLELSIQDKSELQYMQMIDVNTVLIGTNDIVFSYDWKTKDSSIIYKLNEGFLARFYLVSESNELLYVLRLINSEDNSFSTQLLKADLNKKNVESVMKDIRDFSYFDKEHILLKTYESNKVLVSSLNGKIQTSMSLDSNNKDAGLFWIDPEHILLLKGRYPHFFENPAAYFTTLPLVLKYADTVLVDLKNGSSRKLDSFRYNNINTLGPFVFRMND